MSKLPILILAFNRPDHVAKVMKVIRDYQPKRLYLACDGPRSNKKDEDILVANTRQTMLNSVDWKCEIKTLFRENNLGCANAVYEAISWFFDQEEYGVICEDDIILGLDFFKFCEELLPRYANNNRIMSISSQNHSHRNDIRNSYVYSYRQDCWGWASWSRAWDKMDMRMSAVPNISLSFLCKRLGVFEGLMWMRSLKSAYKKLDSFNSWATRWFLSVLVEDGLVIVPGVNLSKNIGMDGGEHYNQGDVDPYSKLTINSIEWPMEYNDSFVVDKIQATCDKRDFFRIRMIGLRKKLRKLFIWKV